MLLNQVFKDSHTGRRYRVVLELINDLMLIDIDSDKSWPFPITEEELKQAEFELISDPYPLPSVDEGSPAALRRDEAWMVIEPLLNNYTSLFIKAERNKLIGQLLSSIDKPRLYVTRQLRRYWQRGMVPNALAPDFQKCGAKGRKRREIENKLGRKRSVSSGVGVLVTDEVAELFQLVIEGFFLVNEKLPLTAAKDKAVGLYKARFPNADKSSVPTMAQFRYFYRTNYLPSDVAKIRTPSRIYQKDIRTLTSTSSNLNFGPGARYEIDATIADIYLVSDRDPSVIIGRPVIYLVTDVFSRMVVGMYVGLEYPSWVAAMMALANAFSDKKTFCQEYGITIRNEDWPSAGIPAGIMADRGELLYRQADVLVNRFGIQLSNSRAYRGDDKSVCERYFKTIQSQFRPYVGGIVEPVNGKKRIGYRYELDAVVSLTDFTKILINIVINHNMIHVVKGYDFAPDMPVDLPSIPKELWNWGIQNRTGKLRPCDEMLSRINLLPYETGTLSNMGITFKGMVYTCREAVKAGWFERIRQNRPSKVDIAFDPRQTNTVYLRPDNSFENYWVCELSDRSRRFRDMSFVEAAGVLKAMRRTNALAKEVEAYKKPDVIAAVEEIVAAAQKRQKESKTSMTDTQRLKGIRQNRVKEKEAERKRSIHGGAKPEKFNKPAEVIPLKKNSTINDKLDYPDMDSFLEEEDD
ncbi:Mu transposase C-terminal domain-containing protein [Nitrincola alkalilacustris]|uniref:Mu transposase C-terminal domain-containing protein n=1 Tax=Nitrincola alkalilacustris TaxID=1571224 RepID=UPI00124EE7A4|nr:Mu transposase C-terminal domain-containing protein [Nitrincola alkalilacustris]